MKCYVRVYVLFGKEVLRLLIIKEVEYAVRIIDELSSEGTLSAAAISERQDIPSPFIYKVLKKLEAADILQIKRGAKGGYRLKVDSSQLTLYDVVSAFENTFLVIECMKQDYDCTRNTEFDCCMHREFSRIQSILKTEFRRNSLASLLDHEGEQGCMGCSTKER